MVGVGPAAPGEESDTPEQYLDRWLDRLKQRRTNWSQTPIERGRINGLSFIRIHWSGTDPDNQAKLHGFVYVAKDGPKYIQIRSQDVEAHHEQSLKIAETAALTFKK